jgi:4-diphosphocytidyl-2-C-methyl-D-erythritol kinase
LTAAEGRPAVTRLARAKLNLYLHVIGRRADGYHDLDSLIVFAEIGDRLSFAPAARLTLETVGSFATELGDPADNLVLKAARLLARRFGVAAGAAIRLDKVLPVAAGLGGGSADAAATLLGLAELWGLRASGADLAALAAGLGADVAVCLHGRPAFVGGLGELILPAPPLPQLAIVLANPRRPLATAAVYGTFAGPFSAPVRWAEPVGDTAGLIHLLAERRNDLTRPALALAPEAGEALALLGSLPQVLLARLAGSGATVFAIATDMEAAESAARALAHARPGWWVRATQLA